jgi:hypothetical protein
MVWVAIHIDWSLINHLGIDKQFQRKKIRFAYYFSINLHRIEILTKE